MTGTQRLRAMSLAISDGRLDVGEVSATKFAIEMRSGGYLVNLEADNSGPLRSAMLFDTREAADAFGDANQWIWFNGGMVVAVYVREARQRVTLRSPDGL